MSKDTMPGDRDANSKDEASMSGGFNHQNALAEQVANLSPAAQEKVRTIRELSAERLEAEKRHQQRSHGFRVLKQKVVLMENYIRDPAPRPDAIKSDPSEDLKIIDEQAERVVADKEAFYRRQIEREASANIQQIIVNDRQGKQQRRDDHNQDCEHDY